MADAFDPQHAGGWRTRRAWRRCRRPRSWSCCGCDGDETVVDYGAGTGIYTVAVAAALPDGR